MYEYNMWSCDQDGHDVGEDSLKTLLSLYRLINWVDIIHV